MSTPFQFILDSNGVGKVIFDLPNEKVNKFSLPVLEELEKLVDSLQARTDIKALLFTSGKPETYIAGADLLGFEPAFKDRALLEKLIYTGHRTFNKVEKLPFPTIAVIQGSCVGGGMEFALACKYRIVTDHPKTSLGLPEVTLGLFPGWGGTQRMPRLIGLVEGLGLILSGKPVNAQKAYKLKLADAIAAWEFQDEKIKDFVDLVLKPGGQAQILAKRNRKGFKNWLLEKNPLGRRFVCSSAKKNVLKQTKGHYQAPLVALDLIKETYGLPLQKGLETEIQTVLNTFEKGSEVSLNLINLFFISEALKKDPGVTDGAKPLPIKSVGVLGAGTMGSGIAWLFANNDYPVRLKDINWEALGKGLKTISDLFKKGVKNRKLKPNQANLKFHRISGSVDYSGFQHAGLVIEAAVENLDLKHKILQELEGAVSPEAIIASNTSSLTLAEMSKPMKNPERFVGMHFFNPVNKMPLVEVVAGPKTTSQAVATAVEICKNIGKTPIVVGDCSGFLVNRIFIMGANEVMWMFQQGVNMEKLEKALLDFGMPMSPFLLSDEVGNDVGYHVAKSLEAAYGERMHCPQIIQMVYEKKLYGKKTGSGFYIYKGKEQKPNPAIQTLLASLSPKEVQISDREIRDRMLLSMINEASRCLEEKIVASPGYLDMAMIMGTGFPPFRGGLLRYADRLGIEYIYSQLKHFEGIYGSRFTPSKYIADLRNAKGKFYMDKSGGQKGSAGLGAVQKAPPQQAVVALPEKPAGAQMPRPEGQASEAKALKSREGARG